MRTGATQPARNSPRPIAGRSRSLRPPAPAEPPSPPAPAGEDPPASAATSRWTKLTALATSAGTLVAAGAAVGALWFTGQSLRATNAQLGVSEQTAVTDRFRLAAEQLASDEINVRLSGIYLLDRLAKDSPTDHTTVYALLAAFVRTQSPADTCTEGAPATAIDVQAAVTAIVRRDITRENDADRPDLTRTCLIEVQLAAGERDFPLPARLAGADLSNSNLHGAKLNGADLTGAYLTGALLTLVDLREADMSEAKLPGANLTNSYLYAANLSHAFMVSADLTGAFLLDTDLSEASMSGADLSHADLTGANLTGTDLTDVNLTDVTYDSSTKWPEGFTPPPSAAK